MHYVVGILSLLLALSIGPAYAGNILELGEGQRTTFSGLLIDEATAVAIENDLRQCEQIQRDFQLLKQQVEVQAAQIELQKERIVALEQLVDELVASAIEANKTQTRLNEETLKTIQSLRAALERAHAKRTWLDNFWSFLAGFAGYLIPFLLF